MDADVLLRSVPVDLLTTDDGVIVSRGTMQLHVQGSDARDFIVALLEATREAAASREAMLEEIPEGYREAVGTLLDQLVARRVLVPEDSPLVPEGPAESPLDVFYWNFGMSSAQASEGLNARTLVIVGANFLSRRFATTLLENGLSNLVMVDDPDLRNGRFSAEDGSLSGWPEYLGEPRGVDNWMEDLTPEEIAGVVALSDAGNRMAMRRWNAACVEQGSMFFPVVLDRMRAEIGPLTIPKETACYECLRARQNSNLTDPVKERLPEQAAAAGHMRNTFHGAMAGAVADVAALEIAKLLSRAVNPKIGQLIAMALLEPSMTSHFVLKVPRCRVCSPMLWRPAPDLDKRAFWNRVLMERS